MFVSTHARRVCPRGVKEVRWARIPEEQVRIRSREIGTFFPSCQLYLSSFSDTLRSTKRRYMQMHDVAVPQIGVGVFLCMIVFGHEAGG